MLTTPPAPTAQPSRRAAGLALSLDHVWVIAALALVALRPLLTPIPPNDFWWHMATGRIIVEQGAIPTADSFSYTQTGQPFYNQGWLAQVFMYAVHALGGTPLIVIVQALVIAAAYGLLLRLCILRSGSVRLGVALLLLTTMPLSFDNWLVRPQSYALPIFAAFLTILTEYRLGISRRLWLLPLLMALWVNLHGSFVLGLALIGLTFAGEALTSFRPTTNDERPTTNSEAVVRPPSAVLRPLLIWGSITALALLLNPRGPEVLGYVRDLLGSSQVTSLVTEWAPPTTRDLEGKIFFVFVIACGAALTYARRRPDLTDMLLLGAFLWLALGAGRNVVWFGFVATPLLVAQVATLLPERRPRRGNAGSPAINAALVGMLALLLAAGLPWVKPALFPPSVGALLTADTPVAAVEFLRAQPDRPRRLFHSEAAGSYLIWAAPEQPVFIDTRFELYPYAQWRDYINLSQANNAAALLERYAIDGLLIDLKRQEPLADAIGRDSAWVERYRDEQMVYFTRR
jgi:hypothetical protein